MRYFLFMTALLALFCFTVASQPKPPAKVTFKAKTGDVTFDHAKHAQRENAKCETCHPKLFQQDAKAPINFKAGMHKPAEAAHTSCGACHYAGGKAFSTAGNCANGKCHVKGGAGKS